MITNSKKDNSINMSLLHYIYLITHMYVHTYMIIHSSNNPLPSPLLSFLTSQKALYLEPITLIAVGIMEVPSQSVEKLLMMLSTHRHMGPDQQVSVAGMRVCMFIPMSNYEFSMVQFS